MRSLTGIEPASPFGGESLVRPDVLLTDLAANGGADQAGLNTAL